MVPHRLVWEYQRRGWTKTTFQSYEEMMNCITQTAPMKDLQEVLDRFVFHQSCFVSLEAAEEITKEVILDAYREGITVLELRFSPQFMAECGKLDWDQMMESMLKGQAAAEKECQGKIKVGWIVIVSRNYGPDSGLATAEFAKKWRQYIVRCGPQEINIRPSVPSFVCVSFVICYYYYHLQVLV